MQFTVEKVVMHVVVGALRARVPRQTMENLLRRKSIYEENYLPAAYRSPNDVGVFICL